MKSFSITNVTLLFVIVLSLMFVLYSKHNNITSYSKLNSSLAHKMDSIKISNNWKYIFKENVIDIGTIQQKDSLVNVVFNIENNTKEIVTITDVLVTCGCMVAKYPSGPIKPGDCDSLLVMINLLDKKGPLFQKAMVKFSATEITPVILKVKGFIN